MSTIDYKKTKKEILINKALEDQKMLIENVKQQYGIDFKNRLTLQELQTVNEIIYQKLEEKDEVDIFYEFIDKVISTALFSSVNCEPLNINGLIEAINIANMYYMVFTSDDLKQIKQQIENIKVEAKIIYLKK